MQTIQTPWGLSDRVEMLGNDGIKAVTTQRHGGIYVPLHLNRSIPAHWRAASHNGQGRAGWYEEDCDWAMVALVFPELFTLTQRTSALAIFKHQWTERGKIALNRNDELLLAKAFENDTTADLSLGTGPEGWRVVES